MTTSVVIPVYNGSAYLKRNLPTVLKLGADEIIIIDDASTDDSASVVQSFRSIRLIRNLSNLRFPKTVNTGFNQASGEIIILLNQDVSPHIDLIKNTLPYFANNLKLFAASFNEGEYGWAKVAFNHGFLEYQSEVTKNSHPSFWASGGSAAFRKSIWDKLGGLDTVFSPGYFEDLDIGWRARKHGYEIIWIPNAKVEHERETAFAKAFSPEKLNQVKDRNYLICQWKNLDFNNLRIHFLAVLKRCLKHPKYILPVITAKIYLPQIIYYRLTHQHLLPDSVVFKNA